MSGTRAGGVKAAKTQKRRYGLDVFERIGRKGGSTRTENTKKKGFASFDKEKLIAAGRVGGSNSRKR